MALAGTAALAMWWHIAPEVRAEFEHWHAHEHFPERLSIPGFLRASRWSSSDGAGDGGSDGGTFVLYELSDPAVLRSPAYLARLNAPTAWSTRLMPHHRQMVRSQCQVLESRGGVTARAALTVRFAPSPGREAELRQALHRLAETVTLQPGIAGLHLLQHAPPPLQATTEQHLRGLADGAAAWVVIASGYSRDAVTALGAGDLGEAALGAMGAAPGAIHQRFDLAYVALGSDVAGIALPAPAAPAD